MVEKDDILDVEDVKTLVHNFYSKIQTDSLLGPIFNGKIEDRWDEHLEKMVRFWQTVLLKEHTYFGSPFPPHAHLPVEAKHFDHWKVLFFETIDTTFEGEKAKEAKWRADKMAQMFLMKIEYYRNNKSTPLL